MIKISPVINGAPSKNQTRTSATSSADATFLNGRLSSAELSLPLRKVASAEDVAEVLVWFLEGAPLITGEILIIDSGAHLGKLPSYSSEDL